LGGAIGNGMETSAAFLMGRVLYEEWAAFWPDEDAEDQFVAFFNSHRSTWCRGRLLRGLERHDDRLARRRGQRRELKDRTDGDLVISGGATLVRSLFADGLLDELRVFLHAIVVGHGARLFESTTSHRLELVGNEPFATGVLNLTYTPAGPR
jgi:dihydrofolate reductase